MRQSQQQPSWQYSITVKRMIRTAATARIIPTTTATGVKNSKI